MPRAVAVDLQNPDDAHEYLIDDGAWVPTGYAAGGVSVDGDLMLYVAGGNYAAYAVLVSLTTGEKKLVWKVPMESAKTGGHPGVSGTVLALPYAYWLYSDDSPEALYRFDVRDGSIKMSMGAGTCEIISGTKTGLGACAAAGSGLIVVDFDHDTAALASPSPYRNTNGMLSQDGNDAIWIDFRDPGANDEHGSYDFPWGGEVYHKSLPSGSEDRLTFDTPSSPTMKTAPWAQQGVLAWITKAERTVPNPTGSSAYWYGVGRAMVKRAEEEPFKIGPSNFGFPRPISSGLVGVWLEEQSARAWMVMVDWPSPVDAASE